MSNFNHIVENITEGFTHRRFVEVHGRVVKVVGTLVHAVVPGAEIGELCILRTPSKPDLSAEVVGFNDNLTFLSPIGDVDGISRKTEVYPLGHGHQIKISNDVIGRVLDGMGIPLDGDPLDETKTETCPVQAQAPQPLSRPLITKALPTGVRAIDALCTLGQGQRVGLFSAPGVGKSTLIKMIAKATAADTVVIGLIGERGREVREFIDSLPQKVREKSVIVVATSDKSAIERVKAAFVATTVAEFFRDQGQNVLFLMDSITRFARSIREIGLAAGEPPTRRGFPPSVFKALPQLIERTGSAPKGAITAVYTVLVEGDDVNDPVADETASLLDGQIILSRKLQQQGHYPAIDVLRSLSRCMPQVVEKSHETAANRFRELVAKYEEVKLLVEIGEYERGTSAIADKAIDRHGELMDFLKQDYDEGEPYDYAGIVRHLEDISQ